MNKQLRKDLEAAVKLIEEAKVKLKEAEGIVRDAEAEERDYYDNMPEGLQNGEKGEAALMAADGLDAACDQIDTASSALDEVLSSIESARVVTAATPAAVARQPWTGERWHVVQHNTTLPVSVTYRPVYVQLPTRQLHIGDNDEALPLANRIAALPQLAEALMKMDALVVEMQRLTTDYLSRAGSEHRPQDCLNSLIGLLDGPQQRDAQAAKKAALAAAGAVR